MFVYRAAINPARTGLIRLSWPARSFRFLCSPTTTSQSSARKPQWWDPLAEPAIEVTLLLGTGGGLLGCIGGGFKGIGAALDYIEENDNLPVDQRIPSFLYPFVGLSALGVGLVGGGVTGALTGVLWWVWIPLTVAYVGRHEYIYRKRHVQCTCPVHSNITHKNDPE